MKMTGLTYSTSKWRASPVLQLLVLVLDVSRTILFQMLPHPLLVAPKVRAEPPKALSPDDFVLTTLGHPTPLSTRCWVHSEAPYLRAPPSPLCVAAGRDYVLLSAIARQSSCILRRGSPTHHNQHSAVDLQKWPMSPDSRHSPRDENNTVARSRCLLPAKRTDTERTGRACIPKPWPLSISLVRAVAPCHLHHVQ